MIFMKGELRMERECANCKNYYDMICHLSDEQVEMFNVCHYFKCEKNQ